MKAMMAVHQDVARDWTDDEINLVEAVADRSWSYIERARTDRESRLRPIVDSPPEGWVRGEEAGPNRRR